METTKSNPPGHPSAFLELFPAAEYLPSSQLSFGRSAACEFGERSKEVMLSFILGILRWSRPIITPECPWEIPGQVASLRYRDDASSFPIGCYTPAGPFTPDHPTGEARRECWLLSLKQATEVDATSAPCILCPSLPDFISDCFSILLAEDPVETTIPGFSAPLMIAAGLSNDAAHIRSVAATCITHTIERHPFLIHPALTYSCAKRSGKMMTAPLIRLAAEAGIPVPATPAVIDWISPAFTPNHLCLTHSAEQIHSPPILLSVEYLASLFRLDRDRMRHHGLTDSHGKWVSDSMVHATCALPSSQERRALLGLIFETTAVRHLIGDRQGQPTAMSCLGLDILRRVPDILLSHISGDLDATPLIKEIQESDLLGLILSAPLCWRGKSLVYSWGDFDTLTKQGIPAASERIASKIKRAVQLIKDSSRADDVEACRLIAQLSCRPAIRPPAKEAPAPITSLLGAKLSPEFDAMFESMPSGADARTFIELFLTRLIDAAPPGFINELDPDGMQARSGGSFAGELWNQSSQYCSSSHKLSGHLLDWQLVIYGMKNRTAMLEAQNENGPITRHSSLTSPRRV